MNALPRSIPRPSHSSLPQGAAMDAPALAQDDSVTESDSDVEPTFNKGLKRKAAVGSTSSFKRARHIPVHSESPSIPPVERY